MMKRESSMYLNTPRGVYFTNKGNKYYFHLHRVQEHSEPDKSARGAFYNWLLAERP